MHDAIISLARSFRSALLPLALFAGACSPSYQAADLDVSSNKGLTQNGLTQNGLTQNGLTQNGLTQNGLTQNALTANGLTQNGLTQNALETDVNARIFVKYLIRVAFRPDQCETFDWEDPQTGEFPAVFCGTLALCPQWQAGGIDGDIACQEWVTAGLLAHVNHDGTSVAISARSPSAPLDVLSEYEAHSYRFREGAFWGNLFSEPRVLYAAADVHNATIARLQERVCTDPSQSCDITVVGAVDVESVDPHLERGWACESTTSTSTWNDPNVAFSTETHPEDTANLVETGDEVVSDCHAYLMTPGYTPTSEELATHTSRVVTTYLTEPGVQQRHGCSDAMHPTPSGVCAP